MRPAARTVGKGVVAAAVSALAAEYLPSVAVLGQWTNMRAVPGGICRWQGPPGPGTGAVALTFDDGPHPDGTPAVLDRLDELGLRATFFVLGSAVERRADMVAEIARRGHQLGVHGYDHRHHLARTPAWVRGDLRRAAAALADAGQRPTWYRPTYGQVTAATLRCARRQGWRPVLWSAWGREWATPDPGRVAARVGRRLRGGAIVLLHDSDAYGADGMWRTTLAALSPIADELRRRDLAAVTLDELVR